MYSELEAAVVRELLKYYPRADISIERKSSNYFCMEERHKETKWILYVREGDKEIMFIQNQSLVVIANEVRCHLRGKDIIRAFQEMHKPLMCDDFMNGIS